MAVIEAQALAFELREIVVAEIELDVARQRHQGHALTVGEHALRRGDQQQKAAVAQQRQRRDLAAQRIHRTANEYRRHQPERGGRENRGQPRDQLAAVGTEVRKKGL